jgi:hypothetical protein
MYKYLNKLSVSNMNDDSITLVALMGMVLILMIVFLVGLFLRLPASGGHKGYVTAVDTELFCTNIYFKTELDSSQEDVYTISNHNAFVPELAEARDSKKNVSIRYSRNVIGLCDQEITGIK